MPATAYKDRRLPHKSALCTICGLKTRGATTLMRLTHGVRFYLCADHAAEEFQRKNSGRDFVLTLSRLWHADGCLTAARHRALSTFLEREQTRGRRQQRERPGSYSWKALRNEVEHRGAAGESILSILVDLRERHAHDVADAPAERTIRRWYADRRWEDDDWRTPLRPGFERRDQRRAARAQRERAVVARMRETHAARRDARRRTSAEPPAGVPATTKAAARRTRAP
jgi:hypothetical protein